MTPIQPLNDAPYTPGMNYTLGEIYHHQVLSGDETSSSTLTDETSFNNDADCLTFPWKLHSLLEAAANEGFDHIVSWMDNDASFKVHQPALFVKHILPRFFKRQSKYKSFQRQLNLWQFQRLVGSKGPCNGGYFHVFFHRYDTTLFHLMKRSKFSTPSSSFQERSRHDCFENFEMPKVQHHSRKCLSTKELEPIDIYSSCMLLSEQHVDADALLLHSDIMMTPHGACGSIAKFDELSIHRDFVNLDTSKPQYPNIVASEFVSLTSTSCVLPKSCEMIRKDSFHDCTGNNRQLLSSLETMPGHYFSSSLDDAFDGDELLPHAKSDIGSAPERSSSRVLTAEDWKYVLVGMHMAMNAV